MQAGRAHVLLHLRLAAEVRQRRVVRRIRDADVHDPANAGRASGPQENARVRDGAVEGGDAVGEADPVGVVERLGAGERLPERALIAELGPGALDPLGERIAWRIPPRQGPHRAAAAEQLLGERTTGVGERAGNDIHRQRSIWICVSQLVNVSVPRPPIQTSVP